MDVKDVSYGRVINRHPRTTGAVNRLRLAGLSTPLSRAHLCDFGAVERSANARRANSARIRLSRSHFRARGIARVG